ncbi:hypothetical protein [Sanguibacter sp. Z1732]|uniref:hypothetical protein n=1 Tax=Sanguibacter sp. Z1732 TaxID=3435412 RepID=UPI003D9CA036
MTATTALPPRHAPYVGGDADEALREARWVIEHAITHQPRSLQERIGPSEIGNPCDHCLAAKLAGWKQTEDGVPWLPFLGTAAHTAPSKKHSSPTKTPATPTTLVGAATSSSRR